MELIKKQIHMNQWKGNAVTQITLDEDFIVPDTLEDMDQVILDNARILGENGRIQDEKMTIKGKMEFAVLYRKENGGLETLGGNIPFEEMVNVPGLKEGDDVTTSWILEDMKAEMINSRKLGVQAVITVEIRAEGEENAYAASDVKMSGTERRHDTGKRCAGSKDWDHLTGGAGITQERYLPYPGEYSCYRRKTGYCQAFMEGDPYWKSDGKAFRGTSVSGRPVKCICYL